MHKVKVTSPDLQVLIDKAIKAGWDVKFTKNTHVILLPPNKEYGPIYAASSPSDHRASKNIRSRLRRAGLEV